AARRANAGSRRVRARSAIAPDARGPRLAVPAARLIRRSVAEVPSGAPPIICADELAIDARLQPRRGWRTPPRRGRRPRFQLLASGRLQLRTRSSRSMVEA